MQIKPTGAGTTAGTGAGRARESQAQTPAGTEGRIAPREGGNRSDRIEISGAARELLEARSRQETSSGHLDPERARAILDRIGDGTYERPEVKNEVLRRIAAELGLTSP